jgi:hypothetical protein
VTKTELGQWRCLVLDHPRSTINTSPDTCSTRPLSHLITEYICTFWRLLSPDPIGPVSGKVLCWRGYATTKRQGSYMKLPSMKRIHDSHLSSILHPSNDLSKSRRIFDLISEMHALRRRTRTERTTVMD